MNENIQCTKSDEKRMYSYLYLNQNPAVMIEKKFDKSGKFFFNNKTIVLGTYILNIDAVLIASWPDKIQCFWLCT